MSYKNKVKLKISKQILIIMAYNYIKLDLHTVKCVCRLVPSKTDLLYGWGVDSQLNQQH